MNVGGRPAIFGDNPLLSAGPGLSSLGFVRLRGFSSGFSGFECEVDDCDCVDEVLDVVD